MESCSFYESPERLFSALLVVILIVVVVVALVLFRHCLLYQVGV